MAFRADAFSVGVTPEQVSAAAPGALVRNDDPRRFVYIGHSSAVTAAGGFPVGPGETVSVPLKEGTSLYLVAESAGVAVRVLHT